MLARCVLFIVMKIAPKTPEPYCRMFEGKKGGNEEANKKPLGLSERGKGLIIKFVCHPSGGRRMGGGGSSMRNFFNQGSL
jgi:hypothetical protein